MTDVTVPAVVAKLSAPTVVAEVSVPAVVTEVFVGLPALVTVASCSD